MPLFPRAISAVQAFLRAYCSLKVFEEFWREPNRSLTCGLLPSHLRYCNSQLAQGEGAAMNGGDSSPVMTDSERRAYRYGQAASRLQGMRKLWSNDSLASNYGATCVCAPTTHPGSFRCKHHRHAAAGAHGMAAQQQEPFAADTGEKHHETGNAAPADQERAS